MASQTVYFDNPSTINQIAAGRPYGFLSDQVSSVQSSVPDYEWAARVQLAQSARFIAKYGDIEATQCQDCQANHVSCRVPTGWLDPANTGAGFKYSLVPSAYDSTGFTGAGGVMGPTWNLLDLDINNLNKQFLTMPFGAFLEEATASTMLKVNCSTTYAPTVANVIYVTGAQDYMRTNGYSFASAFPSVHLPIYLNEPRAHAICHLHGIAEALASLSKGMYPLSEIQQITAVHMDYLEYPGFLNSEGGPDRTQAPVVAQNYQNFLNDMLTQFNYTGATGPTCNLNQLPVNSTNQGVRPTNAQYNYESKFWYVLKNHGVTAWSSFVNRVGQNAVWIEKHIQNNLSSLPNLNQGLASLYINQSQITVNGVGLSRFTSPEALSYINPTGAQLAFRQQTFTGVQTNIPGVGFTGYAGSTNIFYDGPVHSFLRGDQLDAYYTANTTGYNSSVWGIVDPVVSTAYNFLKTNGDSYITSTGANTFISNNYMRYFSDPWSNPYIRTQTKNLWGILNNAEGKGVGQYAQAFALPGWNL